jgi:hypothetical protein
MSALVSRRITGVDARVPGIARRPPSSATPAPAAAAGSTISMTGRAARDRVVRRLAVITYCMSPRSIMTAPSRSTSSRTSAMCSRALLAR